MDFELDELLSNDYLSMMARFAICTLTNWILVDRLYFPKSRRRDFYFTFMLISIAIFLLPFSSVDKDANFAGVKYQMRLGAYNQLIPPKRLGKNMTYTLQLRWFSQPQLKCVSNTV